MTLEPGQAVCLFCGESMPIDELRKHLIAHRDEDEEDPA